MRINSAVTTNIRFNQQVQLSRLKTIRMRIGDYNSQGFNECSKNKTAISSLKA